MEKTQRNEGEGNKTADRQYRRDTEEFIEAGRVSDAAKKARDARKSDERDALDRAEETGKKPARS